MAEIPKLSIIIPAYQAEKFIANTISKAYEIHKQIEIVIVNDGSKDNTLKVCTELQQLYPNLKIFTQPNKGVSAARNLGIKQAQGQWIFFCDSDDWIDAPNMEIILNRIGKAEDIIYLVAMNFVKPQPEGIVLHPVPDEKLFTPTEFLASLSFQGSSCNYLFPAQLIHNNNITFPEGILNTEDQNFNIKCISCSKGIYSINLPVYNYNHLNESSASHSNKSFKWRIGPLESALNIIEFCKEKKIDIQIVSTQINRLVEYYYFSHIYGTYSTHELKYICNLLSQIAQDCPLITKSLKYRAIRLNPLIGIYLIRVYNKIRF
ncbi:glycosyltransferase family 2 protein [Phocaeicola plebeius]|uniref:glycosyltransferase family 2 protein n=1 Tax=Phocaeicola plebeius TaxID=310297 RepID=UPI003208CE14